MGSNDLCSFHNLLRLLTTQRFRTSINPSYLDLFKHVSLQGRSPSVTCYKNNLILKKAKCFK